MGEQYIAGIETGGTKILARIADTNGKVVANGRWATSTSETAMRHLVEFLTTNVGNARLAAIGMAAFGPIITDPESPDYGMVLTTTKPEWSGSNLRAALAGAFDVPTVVDSDVNAAALAEQSMGAGKGLPSVAYVTVGTGIGCGLAMNGSSLTGVMHPEAGHLPLSRQQGDELPSVCRFHENCAEGLVSGPALRQRLGEGRDLSDDPLVQELVVQYLGQLAASLVLTWSPHRIVWGGGALADANLAPRIEEAMRETLNHYGVGSAVERLGFCVPSALTDAGLEGAIMMARRQACGDGN